MAEPDKAVATMVKNIEAKTGKTLAQLGEVLTASGLTKHGELRGLLMERFGLGHGQANTVVHLCRQSEGQGSAGASEASPDAVLAEIYHGKEALRPLHDAILAMMTALGSFDAAPKKGYVSYRRKKQFAMVGPRTKTAIEVGLAAKSLPAHPRLKEMPPASMCRYTTRISTPAEVDGLLGNWLKQSFDEAG